MLGALAVHGVHSSVLKSDNTPQHKNGNLLASQSGHYNQHSIFGLNRLVECIHSSKLLPAVGLIANYVPVSPCNVAQCADQANKPLDQILAYTNCFPLVIVGQTGKPPVSAYYVAQHAAQADKARLQHHTRLLDHAHLLSRVSNV